MIIISDDSCDSQHQQTITKKLSSVFLKTSLTIRDYLNPERACSTLDSTFNTLWFFSFSQSVNSLLRGFFRLIQFTHFRFVVFRPCIFVEIHVFMDKKSLPCMHLLIISLSSQVWVRSDSRSLLAVVIIMSSIHCNAEPVFQPFWVTDGAFLCHQW